MKIPMTRYLSGSSGSGLIEPIATHSFSMSKSSVVQVQVVNTIDWFRRKCSVGLVLYNHRTFLTNIYFKRLNSKVSWIAYCVSGVVFYP